MGVKVNESRRDDLAGCIDDASGSIAQILPDCGNLAGLDRYRGWTARPARAVNDLPTLDQEIKRVAHIL